MGNLTVGEKNGYSSKSSGSEVTSLRLSDRGSFDGPGFFVCHWRINPYILLRICMSGIFRKEKDP
jgi:hypothetical protein